MAGMRTSKKRLDMQVIEAMASPKDRGRTDFFVGREAEVAHVRRMFREARTAAPKDATTLFYGAAGSGKSCLLERIEEIAAEPGNEHVVAVKVASKALTDEGAFARSVARKIGGSLEEAFRSSERKRFASGVAARVAAPGNAFGSEGGVRAKRERTLSPVHTAFLSLKDVVEESLGRDRAVCLLVDEIQKMDPRPGEDDSVAVLDSLHSGEHGPRIIPIYAGLPNSRDVLRQVSLYRDSSRYSMYVSHLKAGDARMHLAMFLKEAGIPYEPGDLDRFADWVVRGSSSPSDPERRCWPQHVRNCMSALATELVCTGGDLSRVDLGLASLRAEERRRLFYETAQGNRLKASGGLVSRVLEGLDEIAGRTPGANGGAFRAAEILEVISDAQDPSMRGFGYPAGTAGEDGFLSLLKEKGVVVPLPPTEDEEQGWIRPIPTYTEYLRQYGRKRKPSRAQADYLSGDPERIEALGRQADKAWLEGRDLLAEPSFRGEDGRTLLHEMAAAGDVERLEDFGRKGCREGDGFRGTEAVWMQDRRGVTPVHVACSRASGRRCSEMVGHLLQDREVRDVRSHARGNTALHEAVHEHGLEAVLLLLERLPDGTAGSRAEFLDRRNLGGSTALHLAAEANLPEVCRRLVEAGADTEIRDGPDGRGRTALEFAREREFPDMAEILEQAGRERIANGARKAAWSLNPLSWFKK